MYIVSACQEGHIAGKDMLVAMRAVAAWLYGIGKVVASPYESCAPERNQVKCPNMIVEKRLIEPKDATIVSGVPTPSPQLKVVDLMDSEDNLNPVANVLVDAFKRRLVEDRKEYA